ncbi:TPA: CdiA family toxin C-terminal domain-containing protein, partial [Pseudomonas aeruginosa]|nr:EndoU domain-containing protein [Pseudomonas aeruginosa]
PTAAKNLVNAIAESPVSGSMSSQLGAVGGLGRLGGGAKGTANFPEGMSFNPNIKNHLSNFDGLTQKSGISGTYNLDAFSQAVSSNGVKVLSETPGSVKGITTIEYQIPAYDRAGNVIGYKAQPFTKTVYDPKVISDQKVLDLGRQAAASGYVKAVASGDRYYDSTAGGITFRVYLDERTGAVLNFYPK